jgi:Flp pilus assembly protein TadG
MWRSVKCKIERVKALRLDRRAATAAEFAIILPVFTMMMAGTMQYGVLFYTWNMALNGTRSAARALAVGRTDVAGARAIMLAALPPWVSTSSGENGNCSGGNGGCNTAGGDAGSVVASATDAAVGAEVVTRLTFPSSIATVMPLAPMPGNVDVTVRMVKES